ncbi:MAG TPA: P-loop NTPase fold protein [Solirubrobacteraceae bacterium]|nr:P-loop NTPase fold protein [Solirubrobacteraceae bacterium]
MITHLRVAAGDLPAAPNALVGHRRAMSDEIREPVLIQVDGPGKSLFLESLARQLDPQHRSQETAKPQATSLVTHCISPVSPVPGAPDWIAIEFDAWRYQRVAPPWWWLMSAIDKQMRKRLMRTGWHLWLRQRGSDIGLRVLHFAKDALWAIPGALLLIAASAVGDRGALEVAAWFVRAAGGLAALMAIAVSVANAVRRHLLAESPRGATAVLRSTDPMSDLLRRYAFLVRSRHRHIIVLIDNLDRCRADYVVEMLEGIQTLLRHSNSVHLARARPRAVPFIAFVVAADRGWLCDSYVQVYKGFEAAVHEPGRPFGLRFVEKVFDVSLSIPRIAPDALDLASTGCVGSPFAECENELQVRGTLWMLEKASTAPVERRRLRTQAVHRLTSLEIEGGSPPRWQIADTGAQLDLLLAELNPGGAVQRQLDVAYCVKRTGQLLAGHEIEYDGDAIRRLGLWTIIELQWPLLAAHLSRHPEDLATLGMSTPPAGVDAALESVFSHPLAARIAESCSELRMDSDHVTKFSFPIPRRRRNWTLREPDKDSIDHSEVLRSTPRSAEDPVS